MSDENEIVFDRDKLEKLKRRYKECPEGGTFEFEGKEILKSYAKYLIEYLEQRLPR